MTTEERLRFADLVKKHTGFNDGTSLLYADGGYFPSLHVTSSAEIEELANLYDKGQEFRGDSRRAFRY